MHKFLLKILIFSFIITLNACGGFKKVDIKDRGTPEERRRKAVDEGRGIGIGSVIKRKSTTYEFSTSNPMWRATLETLEFLPLNTVDYSGGTIVSDWYSDSNSKNNEALKITIRFLSNEIRSDSLKIITHKKVCIDSNSCKTNVLSSNSKINSELKSVILKKAALLKKQDKQNKKK